MIKIKSKADGFTLDHRDWNKITQIKEVDYSDWNKITQMLLY